MVLVAEILRRRRLEARGGKGIRHTKKNTMQKSLIIQCLAKQMVSNGSEQDSEFHQVHNEVAHRMKEPSVQLEHGHPMFIKAVTHELHPSSLRRHLTRRPVSTEF